MSDQRLSSAGLRITHCVAEAHVNVACLNLHFANFHHNLVSKRRYKEFRKTNKKITLSDVKKAIRLRNLSDIKRKNSPLRIPNGAVIVDTSKLTKAKVFRKISKIVEEKIYLKYGRNFKAK